MARICSTSARDSARELEIIEKFLHPPPPLCVQDFFKNFFLPSCSGLVSPPPHMSPTLKSSALLFEQNNNS